MIAQLLARYTSNQNLHSLVEGVESGSASLEVSLEVSYKHPLTMGPNHLARKCSHLRNDKLKLTFMCKNVNSSSDGLVKNEELTHTYHTLSDGKE